jgi:hypothetical protein
MSYAAIDLPHRPPLAERDANVWRLNEATYDARRLARFRRVLGTFLIILGTPVMVLSRSTDPTIRHVLTLLAFAWLALFVPMARLLCVEWRNGRLADDLRARVFGRGP